jgi:hypothetical protein
MFDIPFIADWKIIQEHWQRLTDRNTDRENEGRIDYDYKVGQKILVQTKVYSAKHSPYGKMTHGQLQQSIQMEQSRFNVEIN